ncbi:MAG: NADAR family protein [Candidatus Woesearchaeota archaeon]
MIRFYDPKDEYGYLSNLSRHGFRLFCSEWPTAEHCYQAMKFFPTDSSLVREIRGAETPRIAAETGRANRDKAYQRWDEIKDDAMRLVVMAKFYSNKEIQEKLVSTGDETLVEASPTDWYWGEGADSRGENRLGRILMEMRGVFSDEETRKQFVEEKFYDFEDDGIKPRTRAGPAAQYRLGLISKLSEHMVIRM